VSSNPAATPARLAEIKRAHGRYKRERDRIEFTLRRAGSNEPENPDDLPDLGEQVAE
jgi:hypothetical protein